MGDTITVIAITLYMLIVLGIACYFVLYIIIGVVDCFREYFTNRFKPSLKIGNLVVEKRSTYAWYIQSIHLCNSVWYIVIDSPTGRKILTHSEFRKSFKVC